MLENVDNDNMFSYGVDVPHEDFRSVQKMYFIKGEVLSKRHLERIENNILLLQ